METDLVLGGVQLGALAILFMQALKVLWLQDEGQLKLASAIVALVFTALWGVGEFVPEAAPVLKIIVTGLSGFATMVLGYAYLAKPALQRVGVKVSVADLTEEE